MNDEKPFNFQTFSGILLLILIIITIIIIYDVNIIEKYKWLFILLFIIILLISFIPSKSKSLYQNYLDIKDLVYKIKKNKEISMLFSVLRFLTGVFYFLYNSF